MKKLVLSLAISCIATLSNAQITLEHTLHGNIRTGTGIVWIYDAFAYVHSTNVIGNYYCDVQEEYIDIYDAEDYSLVKRLNKPATSIYSIISRGLFTNDDKWAFIEYIPRNEPTDDIDNPYQQYYSVQVVTEDGVLLANLKDRVLNESGFDDISVVKVGENYKLLVHPAEERYGYDIYSLPGHGETGFITPSAPQRYAPKYLQAGQVVIRHDDHLFNAQGSRVK